jgi:hypothetical protein
MVVVLDQPLQSHRIRQLRACSYPRARRQGLTLPTAGRVGEILGDVVASCTRLALQRAIEMFMHIIILLYDSQVSELHDTLGLARLLSRHALVIMSGSNSSPILYPCLQ